MSYLLLACRVMIAGVFAASLVSKVRSRRAYADFRSSVEGWRVLPDSWSGAAAAGAVAGEAGVVVLVALPWTVPIGFVAGALLLGAFTFGMAVVLGRAGTTTCRCFGASQRPLGPAHLFRNSLLVAVCVIGTVGAVVAAGPPLAEPRSILALSAAAIGVLLVVRFDDLMALTGWGGSSPNSMGHIGRGR